jgi:F-type H+-transporting ATPase subunit b
MSEHIVAANNFLLPNWTFIAEVIAFLLILAILARYVLRPMQRVLGARQDMIRKQAEDSDAATERLAEAERAYQNALHEARSEAAQIRENARAEAQRTVEDLRAQAQQESARIVARGEEQLHTQRAAIVRDLRGEIGTLAIELSEKIVDQRLGQEGEVSATVDAFLAGLESRENVAEEN